jgi:nitrate reductase NapE component
MAMPTMTEAEARARLLAAQAQVMPGVTDPFAALRAAANPPDLGTARTSKKSSKKAAKAEEEEEEVNLLAVIVFGSLSVTALGGLGMLILLWITSV